MAATLAARFVRRFVVAGCFVLCAATALGMQVRPQDAVWTLSTRCLHRCPAPGETHALAAQRYDGGHWQARSFSDLAAETSSDRIDVLFVHGNRVEPDEVGELICGIYGLLAACDGPAVRLIFWSWPSDQEGGLLRDVQIKDDRSYVEIAWLREALNGLPHLGARSLVGYSFGARIVAGATATYDPSLLVASGEHGLPEANAVRMPQRAVLIAGALDRTKLCPGGAYASAYGRLDRTSVWFNQADPALKRYGFVERGADALGYAGLPNYAAIGGCALDQTNVTNWIGRTHWLSEYLAHPSARNLLRRQALWEDAPEALPLAGTPTTPTTSFAATR